MPNGKNQSTAARPFPQNISKLSESMTVGLIRTGFRKCALFPLDWNVIGTSWLPEKS